MNLKPHYERVKVLKLRESKKKKLGSSEQPHFILQPKESPPAHWSEREVAGLIHYICV